MYGSEFTLQTNVTVCSSINYPTLWRRRMLIFQCRKQKFPIFSLSLFVLRLCLKAKLSQEAFVSFLPSNQSSTHKKALLCLQQQKPKEWKLFIRLFYVFPFLFTVPFLSLTHSLSLTRWSEVKENIEMKAKSKDTRTSYFVVFSRNEHENSKS